MRYTAPIASALFFATVALGADAPFTPVERWKAPRVFHTPFDEAFANHIRIAESAAPAKLLKHEYSPNKAYWFGVIQPDTGKAGPWTTKIFIDRERDRPIQIDLVDHNNWPAEVRWINEKLLYIQVWWGRAVGAYFIFDVEQNKVLAREMIQDGKMLFEQSKERGRRD